MGEPFEVLAKLITDGPPQAPFDSACRINLGHFSRAASIHSSWRTVENYVNFCVSSQELSSSTSPTYVPMRSVSVDPFKSIFPSNAQTTDLYTTLATQLATPIGSAQYEYILGDEDENSNLYYRQIRATMQLVDHLSRNLTSYTDEAPILRAIMYLLSFASPDEVLHTATYFPRFAYDAHIGPEITQTYAMPYADDKIKCQANVCDLETFFRVWPNWNGSSLMNDIAVIPITMNERGRLGLIAKVLVYTDTLWTFGRIVNKCPIRCQGTAYENDFLHLAHLASLVRVPSAHNHAAEFNVLFVVTNLTMEECTTFEIPRANSYEPQAIARIDPATSSRTFTLGATDIEDTIYGWISDPDNWPQLTFELVKLLREMFSTNVGDCAQKMIWLAAELTGYIPLAKSVVSQNDTAEQTAFNLFAYDATDFKFGTSAKLQPHAILRKELQSPGNGKLKLLLDWISTSNTSPSGLPCPGYMKFEFDTVSANAWPVYSSAEFPYCYNCLECDNFGRLAIATGLVKYTPFKSRKFSSNTFSQYLAEASSLLAGVALWAAVEIGYTLYDICRLTSSSTPDRYDYSLSHEVYDLKIAEMYRKAWSGRLYFDADTIEAHSAQLDWRRQIDLLPSIPNCKMTLDALDYWNLPFWYSPAMKEKFTSTRIEAEYQQVRPLAPMATHMLALRRGSRAVQFCEHSKPFDLVCLSGTFYVDELLIAGKSPTDHNPHWLPIHFDYSCWGFLQNIDRIYLEHRTANRCQVAEVATYVLPKLRALASTSEYSVFDKIPCSIMIMEQNLRPLNR